MCWVGRGGLRSRRINKNPAPRGKAISRTFGAAGWSKGVTLDIWMFPKIVGFSPQIIHFNWVFHYKPSILGYCTYFWKHPYTLVLDLFSTYKLTWQLTNCNLRGVSYQVLEIHVFIPQLTTVTLMSVSGWKNFLLGWRCFKRVFRCLDVCILTGSFLFGHFL